MFAWTTEKFFSVHGLKNSIVIGEQVFWAELFYLFIEVKELITYIITINYTYTINTYRYTFYPM